MLYVHLDFENSKTIDALVDSVAYVSAIAQTEMDGIKQQAPTDIFKINDPPDFQIQVANGQLEKPISTTTLKFDIGDNTFSEDFVVMKNLTGPIVGLHFMRRNSVVIDTTYDLIHFPHLTMQARNAAIKTSAKPQPVLIQDSTTVPPMTTKTITAFVDHSSEWHLTGTGTPVGKFTEAASLLIFHSFLTIISKKTAIRITNKTESPYLIKKNTQIAKFSVATPEQSKFIRPVHTAILSMIPEGDPKLTTYLSELLRTNKPGQQSITFWFPTPENPVKTEDHTPIQTQIPKELHELQEKEEQNPKYDLKSQMKNIKRSEWTDTLLTDTKNIAVEYILVDYHDNSARHRMDIGMNREFKVRLTPKDDKAVQPKPTHANPPERKLNH